MGIIIAVLVVSFMIIVREVGQILLAKKGWVL